MLLRTCAWLDPAGMRRSTSAVISAVLMDRHGIAGRRGLGCLDVTASVTLL